MWELETFLLKTISHNLWRLLISKLLFLVLCALFSMCFNVTLRIAYLKKSFKRIREDEIEFYADSDIDLLWKNISAVKSRLEILLQAR